MFGVFLSQDWCCTSIKKNNTLATHSVAFTSCHAFLVNTHNRLEMIQFELTTKRRTASTHLCVYCIITLYHRVIFYIQQWIQILWELKTKQNTNDRNCSFWSPSPPRSPYAGRGDAATDGGITRSVLLLRGVLLTGWKGIELHQPSFLLQPAKSGVFWHHALVPQITGAVL